MAYSLGPVTANLNDTDAVSEHNLGDTTLGDNDFIYIYGQASGTVAAGTCTIDSSTYLITDTAGRHTALTAVADGEYAWVRDDEKFSPLATVV